MNFLWITKEYPLRPDTGAQNYSNGLVRSLLNAGATGTLLTYATEIPVEGLPGLQIRTATAARRPRMLSIASRLQSDAYRLKSGNFAETLRVLLRERFDAVFVDYFAMGWVLPVIRPLLAQHKPILVYVSHNHEQSVRRQVAAAVKNPALRLVLSIDAEKAARMDLELARTADLVVVNTDEDNQAYQQDAPGKAIITLMPAYDGDITPTRPIAKDRPRRVVIMGAFVWIAKQLILRRFLDVAQRPFKAAGIELRVVGKATPEFISDLPVDPDVCKFTGWVADVRPYLADARIGIMPDDVGGGFKHKNLYYIFAGLPVATFRSQCAGLPVDLDRDVIARDSMEELVQAIVENIDNLPLLNGMRERSWAACAKLFDWNERGSRLRAAIETLQATRGRTSGSSDGDALAPLFAPDRRSRA